MKLLALALALLGLALQQKPPDESTLLDSETKIPPGHYCKRKDVPITPREKNAHACDCKMSCTVDAQGNVTEHEDSSCMSYCEKNGRKCTCHIEEPCPEPQHNALMDMDGRIVAMRIRHH
jgi:hypothetical protein